MRNVIALIAAAALAFAAAPSASAAGCGVVRAGGSAYLFYKQGVKCAFGKQAVKKLVRSGGKNKPKGFKCTSGSGFTTGGQCVKRGNKNVYFGWHPGD